MPTYDYKCEKCEHAWEAFYLMAEHDRPTKEPCPECKEEGCVIKCVTMPSGVGVDHNNRRQLENPKGEMREIRQRVKDAPGVKNTKWSSGDKRFDTISRRLQTKDIL